jgi:acyl-coenzyme A thioesterase PaaI-like protein
MAARPGKLFVTGHAVKIGQSIAFTEAKAIDMNERLVATATVTSQLISAGALANKK